MNREIKFRGYCKELKRFVSGDLLHLESDFVKYCYILDWGQKNVKVLVEAGSIGQYTGFKDKNGFHIYEGDIFRIEENDDESTVIYVVVIWVKEWAMFTTLRVDDEYPAYLAEGVDAIDETMFWTYTLEDIDSPKHYPCGNIYENPELLQS